MKYQHIKFELPALSDEAAASVKNFLSALLHAVDEQYHKQIHRHYLHKLDDLMVDAQFNEENLDDPPF